MGRGSRKEPNMAHIAKRLTGSKMACYDELRAMMDCMVKNGLGDADVKCARYHASAVLCMQQSQLKGSNTKAELNLLIQRMVANFKRFGFR